MEEVLRNVRDVLTLSKKIMTNIRKIERTREEGRRVKLSQVLERQTSKFAEYKETLRLLRDVAFDLNLSLYSRNMKSIDQLTNPDERLARQLDRGKLYYSRLIREIPDYVNILRENLSRVRILKQILVKKGQAASASDWVKVGDLCLSTGLFRDAKIGFEKSGSLKPSPDGAFGLGKSLLNLCEYSGAVEHLRSAARNNPGLKDTAVLLEDSERRLSDWEAEAGGIRGKKIQQGRSSFMSDSLSAARFYLDIGNPEKAEERLREEPSHRDIPWEILLELCLKYEDLEKLETCVAAYEWCLGLHPDQPEFYRELGRLMIRLGEIDRSVLFLKAAAERGLGGPEYMEQVGDLLASSGAFKEAAAFYEESLKEKPENTDCIEKTAMAYHQMVSGSFTN
jgi:tetratricopeptide (TPR) repeat protein